MSQPLVFISYSRDDELEKDKLLSHLGVLQQAGLINPWSDDRLRAGQDWRAEITGTIAQAKIAVLLVTANFLNSEFILRAEVPQLLQRYQEEGLVVLPVIARACAWRAVDWLLDKEIRPRNGLPVWSNGGVHVDENLSEIAEEIALIVRPETLAAAHPIPARTRLRSSSGLTPVISPPPVTPPQLRPDSRVLIVDDEPTWQRRLRRILRELGCTVVTASSYEEVAEMLDDFNFNLVTIDLNLDKSTQYADGLELLMRIRESYGPRIPIVVVTGTGNLEEQRRAFRDYNVFDFIQKAKLDLEEFQAIAAQALSVASPVTSQ